MIRPETHQYNWKPKTRSTNDMKLVKELETIRKKLGLRKNELTKLALSTLLLSLSTRSTLTEEWNDWHKTVNE